VVLWAFVIATAVWGSAILGAIMEAVTRTLATILRARPFTRAIDTATAVNPNTKLAVPFRVQRNFKRKSADDSRVEIFLGGIYTIQHE